MCSNRKQFVIAIAAIFASAAPAFAQSAGGVALGDSQGGVTDRAYVMAPPNFAYVIERESGSFLDCGEGMDPRMADSDGRDLAALNCGVTLTETLAIPAAAQSARIVVHY